MMIRRESPPSACNSLCVRWRSLMCWHFFCFKRNQSLKGRPQTVEDVSVVAAISLGLWVFFVTAGRNNNTSLTEQSLPKTDSAVSPSSETDTWSFGPESSDRSAVEQPDHWVLGQVRPADPYPIKSR